MRRFVEGRDVTDLGAGDLTLSHKLVQLGATKVTAVDKELSAGRKATADPRIECVAEYFHNWYGHPDLVFVSWPCNWQDLGLIRIVQRTPTVIYLGKNTDGTMCGGKDFWVALLGREVLAYSPDPSNTLIVYGPKLLKRDLVGEERAGMYLDHMWSFEESERG